jgi:hypothetical protein
MISVGLLIVGSIGLGLSFSYVFARLVSPAEAVQEHFRRIAGRASNVMGL